MPRIIVMMGGNIYKVCMYFGVWTGREVRLPARHPSNAAKVQCQCSAVQVQGVAVNDAKVSGVGTISPLPFTITEHQVQVGWYRPMDQWIGACNGSRLGGQKDLRRRRPEVIVCVCGEVPPGRAGLTRDVERGESNSNNSFTIKSPPPLWKRQAGKVFVGSNNLNNNSLY